MSFPAKSIIKYVVWSLDVWGHSSDECINYDCPCVKELVHVDDDNSEASKEHDDNICKCHFDVNDRSKVGSIEVEVDHKFRNDEVFPDGVWSVSNKKLIQTLVENGFLTLDCTDENTEISGEDDGMMFVDRAKDWKPLLQLEFDSAKAGD